jgi:F0F1-type ATP synthase assembly protein I
MAIASAIGVPFAVLVSSGALIGSYLEKRLQAGPWVTPTGIIAGAALAFWNLVRIVQHVQRTEDESDGGDDGDSTAK